MDFNKHSARRRLIPLRGIALVSSLSFALFSKLAEAAPMPVTLLQSIKFSAAPERATLVVARSGEIVTVGPAAVIMQEGTGELIVVGRPTLAIESGPYTALFTVYAKSGEIASAVREIKDVRLEAAVLLDVSELKRRLSEQKSELRKWDVKGTEQRSKLKKVQEQANTLNSVGRIIDLDAELQVVQDEGERLAASLAVAQDRQRALKSRDNPANFKRREAELSAFLNALSTEIKAAAAPISSTGSDERGSDDPAEKERKKHDLIDATKNEHVDLLKEELARLKQQRAKLEGR